MNPLRRLAPLALAAACSLTPAAAVEWIWLEGESPTASNFNRHGWYEDTSVRKDLMSPGVPEGAQGDWLAHYVPGGTTSTATASYDVVLAEGGSCTWWIRCNPIACTMSVAVDGTPFVPLDLSDYREVVNVATPIDIRWLAWVKVGTFALAPGAHSLAVQASFDAVRGDAHGGIDALCLVNDGWEPMGVVRPDQVLVPPAPDAWFPLHVSDETFDPASITDLSRLIERPSGLRGPLQRAGDRFVFRDAPATPVKFLGTNTGSILPTEALQRQQARLLVKHGIDLVRFHPVQGFLGVLQLDPGLGQRVLDPVRLDRLDRWFAILKEEGVYSDWSLFYPHVLTADDPYPANLRAELPASGSGRDTGGLVAFMQPLQDAEWEWARRLLDHVNPYTGLRYADDPALAVVEVHNEDSVFWHYPLNDLAAGTRFPLHTAELKRQWMAWLAARHVTDAALQAAWGTGLRPGDSVANPNMDVYGAWQMEADGPNLGAGIVQRERARMGDFIRFLAETQRGYYERRRSGIRSLGFQGIVTTTAWMAGGAAAQAANQWCDDAGDAIDRHAYAGGGAGGWFVSTGAVNAGSHLPQPGRGLAGGFSYDSGGVPTVLCQVEDKPVMLSEWCQSTPNEWKAEAAPLAILYGMGLQGWDALVHFAGSTPRMGSGWPWSLRAPSPFATETPAYLGQFPALSLAMRRGDIQEGPLVAARRLPTDAIFGGYDAVTRDVPSGAYPAGTNVSTPPEVAAIGRVTFQASARPAPSARTDWSLDWDQAAQVVTSATGEMTWDYGNRVVTVASPRTHAIVGWAGGRDFDLPGALVHVDTPFVSLILTSLDDLPLVDSTHVLVTALARDRQLGTQYSADGSQLLAIGGPPLLLEPVQATITFRGAAITSARVVDLHGVPTATDVQRAGNTITIDGRYQAYYYEIRRQPAIPTCLCRTQASDLSPLTPPASALFLGAPGPDGVTLDPSAPLAEVPYLCPFASGGTDPDSVLQPGSSPLIYYQVGSTAPVTLRVAKDTAGRTVRIDF